jgi:hypothetical protein
VDKGLSPGDALDSDLGPSGDSGEQSKLEPPNTPLSDAIIEITTWTSRKMPIGTRKGEFEPRRWA